LNPLPPIVPVFPLPDVVLFPDTILPLHIFEPRYRKMVRDSSRGHGLIGMALLRPAGDAGRGERPDMHSVGTVGRIEQLTPLPDGRFTLNLVGLVRVKYRELISDKPYRLAGIRPLAEREVDENDPRVTRAKLDLLAAQAMLTHEIEGEQAPTLFVDERLSFTRAVNGACANLPVTAELRQELLALDDLFERQQRVSRLISGLLESLLRLRSQRGEPDSPTDPGYS